MTVEQWLGKDNKLGIDIWNKKYKHNDESFDDWLDRVSGGNEDIRKLIVDQKFLFGGRILSNRGIDEKDERTTYSNCYVITPPEDNIESIYETCSKLARTYSLGGGCGVDISNLAPEGARVHNQAKTTSGAVSFMDTFNQVTEQIGQNGRRGALMISIDCRHPDVRKFIKVKTDLGKVTSANISVRVTDDFMEAVENDDDWELHFTRKETGETISETIKAKELYELLCYNNWDYAEPGILFWDNIENYNLLNTNEEFKYAGTNPCLVGSTLISTTDGEIQIKDLVSKNPDVYCMDENGELVIRKASKVWMTRENAEVVTVNTTRGNLTCTPDHLIHTRNRGWVAACDLVKGDKLTGLNRQMKDELHVAVGLSGSKYTPEHRLVAGYYSDIIDKDVHHIDGDPFNNRRDNLEVLSHGEHSKLSNIGRHIDVERDELGRYVSKQVKSKRRSTNLASGVGTNWIVQDVVWNEERQDVYDMTVPDVHNFVANRIVVHNCAEEPLPAGGSCLLGSVNLAAFVKSSDDGSTYFDYDSFDETVALATHEMNVVLDEGLPKHPLQEQRDSVRGWRQIGIGIMGLADCLIKLGITYGSEEAVTFSDFVGSTMARAAIRQSCIMAKASGTYPKYNRNVLESNFFQAHADDSLYKLVDKHGMRNSQLLTIAPTGTISTMIGVSGGIEPIFANSYTRTTKSLHGHDEVYKVYTPIVADYMEEHGIDDESDLPEYFVTSATIPIDNRIAMQSVWQKHIDASISSTINLPNEATVEDVEHLYMQAWKANLKGVTVFREGCSRVAILNTTDDKPDVGEPSKQTVTELPRGTVINCSDDVVGKKRKLQTGCGSLHVLAFFDPTTAELQEVYLSKGSTGGCANFMTGLSRTISMLCRAGVDVYTIKDQLDSCGVCPSYATRTATKHDTSKGSCCPMAVGNALIEMYQEMLEEVSCDEDEDCEISEETYVQHSHDKSRCPECGEPLTREGGCIQCKNCGWSKCD